MLQNFDTNWLSNHPRKAKWQKLASDLNTSCEKKIVKLGLLNLVGFSSVVSWKRRTGKPGPAGGESWVVPTCTMF